MILYALHCKDCGHEFEAWFRNSDSYDKQVASGDVECPYCGSKDISKAPMAPNIASSKAGESESPAPAASEADIDAISDQRAQEVAQQILDAVGRIRFNAVTGNYSRGAAGIWIENGQLAYPVSELTIAGNLNDMLNQIEMVGNDLRPQSPVAAPTVKVARMTVAGE